jgi:hypothetical protein
VSGCAVCGDKRVSAWPVWWAKMRKRRSRRRKR